jgi:glycosyltransferase involved in cell wall biosynthesis
MTAGPHMRSIPPTTEGPPLRIAVWNAAGLPHYFTTGIGKVLVNVVGALDRKPGVEVVFHVPKRPTASAVADPDLSPLGWLKRRTVPHTAPALDAMWRTTGWPSFDRWAGDCSWLFCPLELWCPPGRMKYAIVVHDVYQFESDFPHRSWRLSMKRRLVWERALKRADVIFSVSGFTKQRLVALFGIDDRKVVVCPNAVEASYTNRDEEGDRQIAKQFIKGPYVLNVGGLRRKKGGAAQLALAAELARRKLDLRLLIVGPVDPEFAEEARGRSHLVLVERGIPDESLRALTAQARVCMMLSEYEGFGIPLLEGMASGVPVLGANRASIPEVVGSPEFLVEPGDTSSIADRIERLHADSMARHDAVQKGKARVAMFSWDKSAEIILGAMRARS